MDKNRSETSLSELGRPPGFRAGRRASLRRIRTFSRNESGAVAIITAILLVVLLGFLALVVDIGRVAVVRNQLQDAADACALRGARAFYPDVEPIAEPADKNQAEQQAEAAVGNNSADSNQLVTLSNVVTGVWDFENRTWLNPPPLFDWPPDGSYYGRVIGPGISVSIEKSGSLNQGPVSMAFARVFGEDSATQDVAARATAALTPLGEENGDDWEANGQPPPLQIGSAYAGEEGDNIHITLSPDTTDKGGWHSYNDGNPNKPILEDLIWGKTKNGDDYTIPDINTDDSSESSINRLNGVVADLFSPTNSRSIYNKWLQMTGAILDADGNVINDPSRSTYISGTTPLYTPWEVKLPVTSSEDGPYVGTAPVLGFVWCTIDYVYPSNYPDVNKKLGIDITITHKFEVEQGSGGGSAAYYGILSLNPVLVPNPAPN